MSSAKWPIFLLLTALVKRVSSQATVTIQVGQFYDPRTVNAFVGDVVEFVFESGMHGVTQSSFVNPCTQVQGGFNSGLVPGFAPNSSLQSPVWQLTVTDTTNPIYFYCQALTPSFHCSNGMVGGINVANDMYSSFSSAAKSLSGTPSQTMSAVLTGSGASAAATPIALAQTPGFVGTTTAAPQSSSTSASSTSSSSSTPTATHSSGSSSSKGAAIGGGIGGAAAALIIGVLAFLLFRKKKKETREQQPSWGGSDMGQRERFDITSDGTVYNRNTMLSNKTDPNDTYSNVPGLVYGTQQNPAHRNQSYTGQQDHPGSAGGYGRETFYGAPQPQPSPPPQTSPGAGPSSGQERYSTFADTAGAQGGGMPGQNQGVDIQAIAKEVAALIVPHINNVRDSASESPNTSMRSLPNPHEQITQTVPRGMTPAPEYSTVHKRPY